MSKSIFIYSLLIFVSFSTFALPQPERKQGIIIESEKGLAINKIGNNSTVTSDIYTSGSKIINSRLNNKNSGRIENIAYSGSVINSGILARNAKISSSKLVNKTKGKGYNTAVGSSEINYGIKADKTVIRNSRIRNTNNGIINNYASGNSYINSGVDLSGKIDVKENVNKNKAAGIKNILVEEGTLELSFVDSSYDNDDYTLAEAGKNKKVFILKPGQGLDTITGIVQRYENIGSIKLYTLGNSKRLIIGDDVINVIGTGSDETNYGFLGSWSPHLAKRTVVSIYSDFIAKNKSGKEFLNKLDEEFNKNTASYVTVMGSTKRLGDGDGENYVLNYWSRAIEPTAENVALAKREANKIDKSII